MLKHGADVHTECVIDLRISSKKMKPLHYLAKAIRLNGLSKEEKEILEVFKKNKIQARDMKEILGVQRQMLRLSSSQFIDDRAVE